MKAPVASVVEFVTSDKIVLVEGPSEYMLFEKFYMAVTDCKSEKDGVHIIDIRGLSFKRYLEIASLTKSKVAVITDNDGDKQRNCIDKYAGFAGNINIEIFSENDNENGHLKLFCIMTIKSYAISFLARMHWNIC